MEEVYDIDGKGYIEGAMRVEKLPQSERDAMKPFERIELRYCAPISPREYLGIKGKHGFFPYVTDIMPYCGPDNLPTLEAFANQIGVEVVAMEVRCFNL